MKTTKIAVMIFIFLINLAITTPSWADETSNLNPNSDYFVGQKIVWLYKARADSDKIQKITGEVVKLGSKQVQIKVQKNQNDFVNRWVNRDRLEVDHREDHSKHPI